MKQGNIMMLRKRPSEGPAEQEALNQINNSLQRILGSKDVWTDDYTV